MTRYSRRSPSPPRKRLRRDVSNGTSTTDSEMDTQEVENEPSLSGSQSWSSWSVEELAEHLEEQSMEDIADVFREQEIKGRNLALITDEMLKNMGIMKLGKLLDFQQFKEKLGCVSSLQNTYHPNTKIFNDPIHGHIELHPLCVKIIDTPQFQRLRFLKQLGGCYFVFPGASHNRFEHSIGVCHLAGQLAQVLRRRQPELNINETDVLCVKIAGLCHDLGHGPFSHLFDGEFIPRTCNGKKWKHEDGSVMMFDHLVRENQLEAEFEKFNLYKNDRIFIKEQIRGPLHATETQTGYEYEGRGKEKSFLYEIVANKRNGIDVDKWDYFARDCHMLGIRNNFDHNRFMKFSRVIQVNGVMQICARDKEACTLYDMFNTRSTLHRRAYQHKVNKVIETMITEALIKADDHIKIPGKDGKLLKMSECVEDMFAYTKLTDSILQQIQMSTGPELEPSRTIINNILCRRLYKCVGQSQPNSNNVINREEMLKMKKQLIECMSEEDQDTDTPLQEDDIILHMVYLDYGMKDKNPMDNVYFYNKANPDKAVKVPKSEVSKMLPERFAEQMILVYCKDLTSASKLGIASRCFHNWCLKHDMETPKQSGWESTPVIKRGSSEGPPVTPSNDSRDGATKPETPSTAGKFKQKLIF